LSYFIKTNIQLRRIITIILAEFVGIFGCNALKH